MDELFNSLLELKWRGLSVPFKSLDSEGSQDLAGHKRVDRQGVRLEGTGRNGYVFKVQIPFLNGLAQAKQENWQNLFPETFLVFQGFLEDRSSGELQHPLYGKINCKAATWKISLTSDVRSGVIAEVVFEETSDDDEAQTIGGASGTLGAVNAAAIDLDAQLGQLNPPFDNGLKDAGFGSFEDFANQLSSIGDQASLLKNKVFGKIDNVIGSLNKISDSIDETAVMVAGIPGDIATRTTALGNSAARIVESVNRMNFALVGLKSSIQTKDQSISFFVTTIDSTLGGLAAQLNNKVEDLVQLNPLLVAAPVILPQTPIRYYKGGGLKVASPFS